VNPRTENLRINLQTTRARLYETERNNKVLRSLAVVGWLLVMVLLTQVPA